jgi:hypothetical protein
MRKAVLQLFYGAVVVLLAGAPSWHRRLLGSVCS